MKALTLASIVTLSLGIAGCGLLVKAASGAAIGGGAGWLIAGPPGAAIGAGAGAIAVPIVF